MKRGPYKFREGQWLEAARILAAREGLAHFVLPTGIAPEADDAELRPGSPPWALLLVCRVLWKNERTRLCFDFLSHALAHHTNAAASLVDAAIFGPEAVDAWINSHAPAAALEVA